MSINRFPLKEIQILLWDFQEFFFFLQCTACRILVPQPGMEPRVWKHRVLTTGLPGNSLEIFFWNIFDLCWVESWLSWLVISTCNRRKLRHVEGFLYGEKFPKNIFMHEVSFLTRVRQGCTDTAEETARSKRLQPILTKPPGPPL